MAKGILRSRAAKIIISVLVVVALGATVFLSVGSSNGTISKGNSKQYNASELIKNEDSLMQDDLIAFLGSDFVYGTKSDGQSFVDYLVKVDGIKAKKYGGEGYTLNGKGEGSLVESLNSVIKNGLNPMVLFCEVPVCNEKGRLKLGELTGSYFIGDYDTSTIIGAMEYICSSADMNWGCKVVFITCPNDDNKKYAQIVEAANQVAQKWNSGILNFYDNEEIVIDKKQRRLYFVDSSSPTKAGYNAVYGPMAEEYINDKFHM